MVVMVVVGGLPCNVGVKLSFYLANLIMKHRVFLAIFVARRNEVWD